jgi:hypothetical protein
MQIRYTRCGSTVGYSCLDDTSKTFSWYGASYYSFVIALCYVYKLLSKLSARFFCLFEEFELFALNTAKSTFFRLDAFAYRVSYLWHSLAKVHINFTQALLS